MAPPVVVQPAKRPDVAKIFPPDADAIDPPSVAANAPVAPANPPTATVTVAPKIAPAVAATPAAPNPALVTGNASVESIAKNSQETPRAISTEVADNAPPPFDRRILAAHNRERQTLGLEPLSWNPALAQSAQRWADHLAQTGRFEHAPENHVAPEGENLWAGTKGYYTPEAMVDAWIREKRFFRPGTFPDNSTTGRVEDIGHYTQVVWRATREVGCAEATSAGEDILVCRYAEAGNYRGEQPF
jgi:uncharacterized protein YkwD